MSSCLKTDQPNNVRFSQYQARFNHWFKESKQNAWNGWVCGIKNGYEKVRDTRIDFFASIVVSLLIEPLSALYAGALMNLADRGLVNINPRNLNNLNPKKLDIPQQRHSFVLCVHGDYSGPELFFPLISKLSTERPHSPVFTVKLGDGIVGGETHLEALINKVKEILMLYKPFNTCPNIVLVGHSNGGNILPGLVKKLKEDRGLQNAFRIQACLKVGSTFRNAQEGKDFRSNYCLNTKEICGHYDVFEGSHSLLQGCPEPIETGHIGLLFHDQVIQQVVSEVDPEERSIIDQALTSLTQAGQLDYEDLGKWRDLLLERMILEGKKTA